jgi:hypothetical protein
VTHAPSFDVLGSLFPAWLVCLMLALLLTIAVRWLLTRIGVVLWLPVLAYPGLTALVTLSLWLAFFR